MAVAQRTNTIRNNPTGTHDGHSKSHWLGVELAEGRARPFTATHFQPLTGTHPAVGDMVLSCTWFSSGPCFCFDLSAFDN